MKKLVVLAIAAAGGILAKRKFDEGREEQAAWKQATDPVQPSA